MRKYQRILSIFGALSLLVVLLVSSTTALLTDKEQVETLFQVDPSEVEITLHVDIDAGLEDEDDPIKVDPGKSFGINPWIESTGSKEIYVFIELDIPVVEVNGKNIELFTPEALGSWHKFDLTEGTDYNKYYYAYGLADSLTSIDSYGDTLDNPLITAATFNNIKSDDELELTLIIKAYAVEIEAYEEEGIGSPADVWEDTVTIAG